VHFGKHTPPLKPWTQTPGELARAALSVEPDLARLREIAARVATGDWGPWPPAPEALRELAEKVRKTAESSLLVNEAQRRTQVDAVLAEAAESRYRGAGGELAARRFEECAWCAWKRGNEEDARLCIAAARGFRERPPGENPVARSLVERALGPFLEALRSEQASSLLVRP